MSNLPKLLDGTFVVIFQIITSDGHTDWTTISRELPQTSIDRIDVVMRLAALDAAVNVRDVSIVAQICQQPIHCDDDAGIAISEIRPRHYDVTIQPNTNNIASADVTGSRLDSSGVTLSSRDRIRVNWSSMSSQFEALLVAIETQAVSALTFISRTEMDISRTTVNITVYVMFCSRQASMCNDKH